MGSLGQAAATTVTAAANAAVNIHHALKVQKMQ